jgi:pilus assembly protein CpaB
MGVARIAILALAALAAGVAAFLVQGLISSGGNKSDNGKTTTLNVTEVLVAAKDLSLGQQVTAADVRWQPWPEGAITPAYFVKSQDAQAMQKAVGGTVRQAMLAGEPLTSQKVVHADGAGFMSAILSPGMRAVSVAITVETGAGGFILPNDRVDVLLTSRGRGGASQQDSRTILTNIRVLAIDQTYREEGGKQVVIGKTATVELSPPQAETLAQAAASGVVSLALRSLADVDAKEPEHKEANTFSGSVTILRYGSPSRVTLSGVDQ